VLVVDGYEIDLCVVIIFIVYGEVIVVCVFD